MIDGHSRILIPYDRRLSLVRNSNGGDILCRRPYHIHRFHRDSHLACPDLIGIVFYPAWLWKILLKLPLGDAAHLTSLVK